MIERCAPEDAGLVYQEPPPDSLREDIEAYFANFAKPECPDSEGAAFLACQPCINCGEPQMGMGGHFQWGLVHGEGSCTNCGWPGRAHHYVKDRDGKELFSLRNVLLQYHPSVVEKRKT